MRNLLRLLLVGSPLALLVVPSAWAVPFNCGDPDGPAFAVGQNTYDFACASAAWSADLALCFPSTAPLDWLAKCLSIVNLDGSDPQQGRTLGYVSCYLNEGIVSWEGKCL